MSHDVKYFWAFVGNLNDIVSFIEGNNPTLELKILFYIIFYFKLIFKDVEFLVLNLKVWQSQLPKLR